MRHLLFLAHRIPYPPDKGDKIRSFHILQHLAQRFRVHLGCFCDSAADEAHADALRLHCEEVFCLPLGPVRKLVRGIGGLTRGRSVSEACYRDARMERWTRQTLERFGIEDAFVFCSTMAPYISGHPPGRRVVFDMVDMDSEKWRAYSGAASWPRRLLYGFEQRQVAALERRAGAASDAILFVSHAEAGSYASLFPELSERTSVVENGVDLEYFDPARTHANPFGEGKMPIVFTGAMDYRANIDAAVWFGRETFPAIRRAYPNAEFWVVGRNPPRAVRRLSRIDGIGVTGAVPDVRPYLAHAACVVGPMRIARGIQNKVLEAMAMAKPTVVTSMVLEGLRVDGGREVMVADDATEFADAVCGILSGRRNGLGNAARARVQRDYNWPDKLRLLDGLFPGPVDRLAGKEPAVFAGVP